MEARLAVIGEAMLEVNRLPDGSPDGSPGSDKKSSLPASLAYGGDTLNSSVYLARLGVSVEYVTALGDDHMSAWMIDQWRSENVGCHLIQRCRGSVPGLYLIEVDEHGERSFLYWRENSPATRLFDDVEDARQLMNLLMGFTHIYLTGITLALYAEPALNRLLAFLKEYRAAGGQVIFDGNYRPRLWQGRDRAAEVYEEIYGLTDIALPTIEDEQMVFGNHTPDVIVSRLHGWGVSEVILKMGGRGCLISFDGTSRLVESNKVKVVDTTAAGDSFNAGYLASRVQGADPDKAAVSGHNLASTVIQHRGAIIPLSEMPTA